MNEFSEKSPPEVREPEAHKLFVSLYNIHPELAKEALYKQGIDPKVGITIAKLDFPPVNYEGYDYRFYAARVLASTEGGKQPYVTPHLHKHGVEPYHFFGNGEMNFGNLSQDGKSVEWRAPSFVRMDDQVLIQENEVHSFRNTGEGDTDFIFACPDGHLVDNSAEHPEGDRYIVKQLENGLPPHYPR